MDELKRRLEPVSFRVTRAECSDAPSKIYSKRYVELAPAQKRVYNQLTRDYVAELDGGVTITAPLAMVRLLRLQQIVCGHAPAASEWSDDPCTVCAGTGKAVGDTCWSCCGSGMTWVERPSTDIIPPTENPRVIALIEELQRHGGRAVIWARFSRDITIILEAIKRAGLPRAVRYDGQVPIDERAAARAEFQNGQAHYLVGNPHAGGRGLKLAAATLIVYFSNDFSLATRLQSEDRAEDLDKTISTDVLDIICTETVDEKIVASLRANRRVADTVMGDGLRSWL